MTNSFASHVHPPVPPPGACGWRVERPFRGDPTAIGSLRTSPTLWHRLAGHSALGTPIAACGMSLRPTSPLHLVPFLPSDAARCPSCFAPAAPATAPRHR